MQNLSASNPREYLQEIPADRLQLMTKLFELIDRTIPQGFSQAMTYGMISWVVPHSIYPDGYHCDPKMPLPFVSLANQKNHIGFYHMGFYHPKIADWFVSAWPQHTTARLDLGKACLRLNPKKPDLVPFDLLTDILGKLSVTEWIDYYENTVKSSRKKSA